MLGICIFNMQAFGWNQNIHYPSSFILLSFKQEYCATIVQENVGRSLISLPVIYNMLATGRDEMNLIHLIVLYEIIKFKEKEKFSHWIKFWACSK